MKRRFQTKRVLYVVGVLAIVAQFLSPAVSYAQYEIKWMAVGSLHNWFSAIGCEIEEGFILRQQYGLQWPAIYPYQDMQAAKGFWIGVKNFTDERGDHYTDKVVHVGPRVSGANEFFPVKFEMVSKLDPPLTLVDGVPSFEKPVDNNSIDPTIPADRMIINEVNTGVGITMVRKIMQFSQQYHDNYMVYDYTFTNTGNVDADADIELPSTTLEGVYFFFQYRYSVCAQTRYVIGNATGWGINAMLDTRGDGLNPATTFFPGNQDNDVRAQYAWHGKYPPFTAYDNIGGPIWTPDGTYAASTDTIGRLGASQFVGLVTLHVDKSATDPSDDLSQPSTTTYQSSDDPLTSNNSAFNPVKMGLEYGWLTLGHTSPRHADKVGATGDPALGTPGGFSNMNGYGPYTLLPGQSIHIVMAEGAAGLSREKNIEIGKQFKNKQITAEQKNAAVYTGRDSLFQTFRRAIANYESGYTIPQPPLPPKLFNVHGGGDRISLSWDVYDPADPNLKGFEIYRATGQYDSTYKMIYAAGPSERSYDDTALIRGVSYYYYIVSVGDPANNTGAGMTPGGKLVSSRYYTQAYDPSFLKRPAGTSLDQIRVVPNPYNIASDASRLRFPNEPDKLGFFNIPGQCTIKIFTESGELVKTIEHTDGSGDEYWNSVTSSNQVVVSGVYIAVVTDNETGKSEVVKFVIIR